MLPPQRLARSPTDDGGVRIEEKNLDAAVACRSLAYASGWCARGGDSQSLLGDAVAVEVIGDRLTAGGAELAGRSESILAAFIGGSCGWPARSKAGDHDAQLAGVVGLSKRARSSSWRLPSAVSVAVFVVERDRQIDLCGAGDCVILQAAIAAGESQEVRRRRSEIRGNGFIA